MRKMFRRFTIILAAAALLSAAGCSKKEEIKPDETPVPTATDADLNKATADAGGDSDSGKAMGLQTVHFPYDAFVLDQEAKSVLKANTDILKDKTSLKIQVEGHCDQRGGIQYNIALGEKRANIVKKYMEDQGISADRITTISFGKERPIDPGTSEEAYGKNRRANFVVTSK